MHLVLAGQPRLAAMLAAPRLEQLRQRISIIARLQPLDREETRQYILHRLSVAGWEAGKGLFTKQAMALITENAGGIPRNINNLCFNAMSLACAMKAKRIEADVVKEVISDLRLDLDVEEPSDGAEREARRGTNAANPSMTKSPWLGAWRLMVALPLGLLAFLGAGVTWRGVHSASLVDRQMVTSETSMASAGLPSTSDVAKDGSDAPEESEDIADTGRSSIVSMPTNPNLRSTSVEKEQSGLPRVVTVQPNQTMYRLCMEMLGRYDDATKTKIRKLNPGFINLTHITPGQRVVLPAREELRKKVSVSVPPVLAMPERASNR